MASKKKRRGAKRSPPKGFRTWRAYMASIRPNSPKKRRAPVAKKRRKAAKRPRGAVVIVNRPTKRRGRPRRRNPNLGAFVQDAFGMVLNGALGGGVIVATEIGTRLVRRRVFGMPAGSLIAGATEVGLSTTAGLFANHLLPGRWGSRIGQLIIDAGFASVGRATVKQSNAPWVSDALADDGPSRLRVVNNGRTVRRAALGGYVPGATRLNGTRATVLGGYVPGMTPGSVSESANAAAMTMDYR